MSSENRPNAAPADGDGATCSCPSSTPSSISRIRVIWRVLLSCVFSPTHPPASVVVRRTSSPHPSQLHQQQHSASCVSSPEPPTLRNGICNSTSNNSNNVAITANTIAATNPVYNAAPVPSLAAGSSVIPFAPNCYMTQSTNAALSSTSMLDLMRAYHFYIHAQKPPWRRLLLLLLVLLCYTYCTCCGRSDLPMQGLLSVYGGMALRLPHASDGVSYLAHGNQQQQQHGGGGGDGTGVSGAAASAAAAAAAAASGQGADPADLVEAAEFKAKVAAVADCAQAARLRQPRGSSFVSRLLFGTPVTTGRTDVTDVDWWDDVETAAPSTLSSEEASYAAALQLAEPDPFSYSLTRASAPWSSDTRTGLFAAVRRATTRLVSPFVEEARPSFVQALYLFLRARQAMSATACGRCIDSIINHAVREQYVHYLGFLSDMKLRVPLQLYYNRIPVYAIHQYLRLIRLRQYQLLDFASRPAGQLGDLAWVAEEMGSAPGLHARELEFELARLALVHYLQRVQLRAMRHADAMRLETFHFLRFLSSTIPVLRQQWVGQDFCKWPGVRCEVMQVPLNQLVDEAHPTVLKFVEEIFSVCRGAACAMRSCVAPSCTAYARHFTRRLFTSSVPAYWAQWRRMEDTAAMDELVYPLDPSLSSTSGDVVESVVPDVSTRSKSSSYAAAAAAAEKTVTKTGVFTLATRKRHDLARTPEETQIAVESMAAELKQLAETPAGVSRPDVVSLSVSAASALTGRSIPGDIRTIWLDHQFAYEHPHLLLGEPTLLVDIDVEPIVREVMPQGRNAKAATASDGGKGCGENAKAAVDSAPAIDELLLMQRRLLRHLASATPKGVRIGKQRATENTFTVPFTFVSLDLANMGLRGYLPDFYDTITSYDNAEGTNSSSNSNDGRTKAAAQTSTPASTTTESNNNDITSTVTSPGASPEVEEEDDGVAGTASKSTRPPSTVQIHLPRSDVYWGKFSRQRMLEMRNFSTLPQRRVIASPSEMAQELLRVLRRVEKIGQRTHHADLAMYFSDTMSMARFQGEHWSLYRWAPEMKTISSVVAQSSAKGLYRVLEESDLVSPTSLRVLNIDHTVDALGELNPRLVGIVSIDVSANPLLGHVFPSTWLSLPYLRRLHTAGTAVLVPALRLHERFYDEPHYCSNTPPPPDSTTSPYTRDAKQSFRRLLLHAVLERAPVATVVTATTGAGSLSAFAPSSPTSVTAEFAGGDAVTFAGIHDRHFIGAKLIPPHTRVDALFVGSDSRGNATQHAEAAASQHQQSQQQQSLGQKVLLYQQLQAALEEIGAMDNVRRMLAKENN